MKICLLGLYLLMIAFFKELLRLLIFLSMFLYRHLQSSRACHDSCDTECFTILDSADSKFKIKIKEALHIKWESPILNQQFRHLDLSLSF